MIKVFACVAACLIFASAFPDAASATLIDDMKGTKKALDACLAADGGGSIRGQEQCYGDAYGAYDKLLNRTYGELMQTLDPASRDLLRRAQRAWLDSRKADTALWSGPWRYQAGTVSQVEGAEADMDAVQSRVVQLQALQIGTE